MALRLRIAFVCHVLATLLLIAFGLIYLFRAEFMPYHAVALGRSWSEIDPASKLLILGLMRVVGGGFIAAAFAIIVLLLKPFRQGQWWAFWAIPVTGLVVGISSLLVTVNMAVKTPASPPWIAASVGSLLFVVGLILALLPGKQP